MHGVPRFMELRTIFCGEEAAENDSRGPDWSKPTVTFPILEGVLSMEEYSDSVLEGLVTGVGCLTESVSSQAKACLLSYARKERGARWRIFNELLERHRRDGRLFLPVLRSLLFLFSNHRMDDVIRRRDSDFAMRLLGNLDAELRNCQDVGRLLVSSDVIFEILNLNVRTNGVHERSLELTYFLLQHPYPRVRGYVAQQLYMFIQDKACFNLCENTSSLSDFILQTAWTTEDRGHSQRAAQEIAGKLGTMLLCESIPTSSSLIPSC
jgi:Tubulin folding cofactor D C terminal